MYHFGMMPVNRELTPANGYFLEFGRCWHVLQKSLNYPSHIAGAGKPLWHLGERNARWIKLLCVGFSKPGFEEYRKLWIPRCRYWHRFAQPWPISTRSTPIDSENYALSARLFCSYQIVFVPKLFANLVCSNLLTDFLRSWSADSATKNRRISVRSNETDQRVRRRGLSDLLSIRDF